MDFYKIYCGFQTISFSPDGDARWNDGRFPACWELPQTWLGHRSFHLELWGYCVLQLSFEGEQVDDWTY